MIRSSALRLGKNIHSRLPETQQKKIPAEGIIKRRALASTAIRRGADVRGLAQLPDTADELRSIAIALHADPAKALFIGKAANEKTVKDLDLSRFRIVAFATHGLVPGDLDGLDQPALALTAPEVAGIDGDGLLTTEEILRLRLNADWVCFPPAIRRPVRTRARKPVSRLGRAFFYAGSRALLATNWSVHSELARELVSDLFQRQTDDPTISRAEALRRAMLGLLDKGGNTFFSYGHPLFWAPYTIIGDGG